MIQKLKHRNHETFLHLALLTKGITYPAIVCWLLKNWFIKTQNSEEVLTNIFFKGIIYMIYYNIKETFQQGDGVSQILPNETNGIVL